MLDARPVNTARSGAETGGAMSLEQHPLHGGQPSASWPSTDKAVLGLSTDITVLNHFILDEHDAASRVRNQRPGRSGTNKVRSWRPDA
jgi:hypothetical protein